MHATLPKRHQGCASAAASSTWRGLQSLHLLLRRRWAQMLTPPQSLCGRCSHTHAHECTNAACVHACVPARMRVLSPLPRARGLGSASKEATSLYVCGSLLIYIYTERETRARAHTHTHIHTHIHTAGRRTVDEEPGQVWLQGTVLQTRLTFTRSHRGEPRRAAARRGMSD